MTEQLQISFDPSKKLATISSMPCIGIFGRKNSGKSSLVNILLRRDATVVANTSGTTKEPSKHIAGIESLGDVVLVDTSGIDDYGDAGEKRVLATLTVLKIIDFAVLVITGNLFAEPEKKLVREFQEYSIPFVVVHNKSDIHELASITRSQVELAYQIKMIAFSCTVNTDASELLNTLKEMIPPSAYITKSILGDVISKNELVLLAVPDKINAREGQLTNSQIEITRDLMDNSCLALFIRQRDLPARIMNISPQPKLAILPASSFKQVENILPKEIQITTYGIVMARNKGDFGRYIEDTPKLSALKDGDKVLIMQASTDNTSPEFKEQDELQNLINDFCRKKIDYVVVNIFDKPFINYRQFQYAVICGSFLLTKNQVAGTLKPLIDLKVPVTSFDMVNAFIRDIFTRAISPFI
jgi:[FeFe] hydrogenase H-cluster maturation GTPase HydF